MAAGADPRAQERVGSVLEEKWTLERLLGAGAMGAVYAARHRNGARAAVKVLHPELARVPEVRERFLREGLAANGVEHRGAVQVLDDGTVKAGPDEGLPYLVMELLEGESLQERAEREPPLGERELLHVMEAVLDVLEAAHDRGVVHRDLKPENIFLARDPERDGVRVKVLDFGLARISASGPVTGRGLAVGTPSFMSPEQATGRTDEIDGRTDLFALGATMFRIATGRRVHEVGNMVQLVIAMGTVPAPAVHSVKPEISETFARIIDRALAFDREARYPNAAAMRADVRAALDGDDDDGALVVIPYSARNVRAFAPTELALEQTAPAKRADRPEESSRRASRPEKGSSSTWPWAIVLVLLAVLAWKLGPELQQELTRRASIFPARKLWTADPAPASSAEPAAIAMPDAAVAVEPDASVQEVQEDAGTTVADATDAGAPTAQVVTPPDAGAPRPIVRPRPPATVAGAKPAAPASAKPPAKKPPEKKPAPRDPRHR